MQYCGLCSMPLQCSSILDFPIPMRLTDTDINAPNDHCTRSISLWITIKIDRPHDKHQQMASIRFQYLFHCSFHSTPIDNPVQLWMEIFSDDFSVLFLLYWLHWDCLMNLFILTEFFVRIWAVSAIRVSTIESQ